MDKKELLASVTLEEFQEVAPALVERIKNDARAAVLKELEEQIKAGKDAGAILARGKKLMALAESGLPKEVIASVRPVVEQDSTTPEGAEALIKAQKEIVEALKPAATGGHPKVKGAGASSEQTLSEVELPSDDELSRAIEG